MTALLQCRRDQVPDHGAARSGPAHPADLLRRVWNWWCRRLARHRAYGGLPECSSHMRADIGLADQQSSHAASAGRLWTV